jgi:hypothetical protein
MGPFDLSALQQALTTHQIAGEIWIDGWNIDRPGDSGLRVVRAELSEGVLTLAMDTGELVHVDGVSGMDLRLFDRDGYRIGDVSLAGRSVTVIRDQHHHPLQRTIRREGERVVFKLDSYTR